jgi:hypothetical protein
MLSIERDQDVALGSVDGDETTVGKCNGAEDVLGPPEDSRPVHAVGRRDDSANRTDRDEAPVAVGDAGPLTIKDRMTGLLWGPRRSSDRRPRHAVGRDHLVGDNVR